MSLVDYAVTGAVAHITLNRPPAVPLPSWYTCPIDGM